MNTLLWRAIDRIGTRKASRLEWEFESGLPWEELSPFVRPAGGHASDVPDPDNPRERLVAWPVEDGNSLLESEAFPAHRPPLKVDSSRLTFYRINTDALGSRLAKALEFIAQPIKQDGPLFTLGFVQDPGARRTDVYLFVPTIDPRLNIATLSRLDRSGHILLIPTARWASIVPPGLQARELAEFFSRHERDHLLNLAEPVDRALNSSPGSKTPVINVRQEDRWEHVSISFNADARVLNVRIEKREGRIPLPTKGMEFTRTAEIFARIAAQDPPRWSNSDFPENEREARRKAFQRFCRDLKSWIPVNDGNPFRLVRSDECHYPRFKCDPLQVRPMKRS